MNNTVNITAVNNTSQPYSPDDIARISEVLKRLGIEYNGANRVAFNHAVERGELENVGTCRVIKLRWGDVEAYMAKGKRFIVAAWVSGAILNQVKAGCRHGTFSSWLEEFAKTSDASVRTLQRYMKVARLSPDIRLLLEGFDSLRKAYIALGIAGAQPDEPPAIGDEDTGGDTTSSPAETNASGAEFKVLSSATTLQKNLRQFDQSGGQLGDDAVRQLRLVIDELQDLIARQEYPTASSQDAA